MEKARLLSLPGIPEGDVKLQSKEKNKRGSHVRDTDWLISRCASTASGDGRWVVHLPRGPSSTEGTPPRPLWLCGLGPPPYCASLPRSPPSAIHDNDVDLPRHTFLNLFSSNTGLL